MVDCRFPKGQGSCIIHATTANNNKPRQCAQGREGYAIKIIIIATRSPLCDNNDFRFRAEICLSACSVSLSLCPSLSLSTSLALYSDSLLLLLLCACATPASALFLGSSYNNKASCHRVLQAAGGAGGTWRDTLSACKRRATKVNNARGKVLFLGSTESTGNTG